MEGSIEADLRSNSISHQLTVITGSILENGAIYCPGIPVAPSESMVCNARYSITTADIGRYQVLRAQSQPVPGL